LVVTAVGTFLKKWRMYRNSYIQKQIFVIIPSNGRPAVPVVYLYSFIVLHLQNGNINTALHVLK
jgi:hypothetical protein